MANTKTKALSARLVSEQLFESVYMYVSVNSRWQSRWCSNHNLHVHFLVLKHCLQNTEQSCPYQEWIDHFSSQQKKQNVLHIAAHYGRLDCLKELHPHVPNTILETDSLYLATDKVSVARQLHLSKTCDRHTTLWAWIPACVFLLPAVV